MLRRLSFLALAGFSAWACGQPASSPTPHSATPPVIAEQDAAAPPPPRHAVRLANDVTLGKDHKVFLACGGLLVERSAQGVRTMATGIAPTQSLVLMSADSSTGEVIARTDDSQTLYWWHGSQVEKIVDGSRWSCADAATHATISTEGEAPNTHVFLLEVATKARSELRVVPSVMAGCALSKERILLQNAKTVDVWDRSTLERAASIPMLPRTEHVANLRLRGARIGWLEGYDDHTQPKSRPRAFLMNGSKAAPTGKGVSALNALASRDLLGFDWDDAGTVFTVDRYTLASNDGTKRGWQTMLTDGNGQGGDCYLGALRVSPDGAHALASRACPPSADSSGSSFADASDPKTPLDLTCPDE